MVPQARGGGDILGGCTDKSLFFTGSWLGNRVAVIGDYTTDEDFPTYPKFGSIYSECVDNLRPMYGYLPGFKEKRKKDSKWQDITCDLVCELETILNKKIIPLDHPTLWPDGMSKKLRV